MPAFDILNLGHTEGLIQAINYDFSLAFVGAFSFVLCRILSINPP